LTLDDSLTEDAISILAEHGLCNIFPTELKEWKARNDKISEQLVNRKAAQKVDLENNISDVMEGTRTIIEKAMIERLKDIFPLVSFLPMVGPVVIDCDHTQNAGFVGFVF
jgi:hypothetical protein